ncbi:hypothetical protein CHCC5027_3529 [Bacillus paralicheniformis]|uniref:hypothetical protein n=1 Tax=Bacillus paralicheniformis TaxID=1648923 RepID=UPI0011A3C40E|nr:hypothetical protein [Bacillus paralicheniformis]TWJ39616.1 hypothetical protein CHCC5027_3529 [Bacillus paralicheniformis]
MHQKSIGKLEFNVVNELSIEIEEKLRKAIELHTSFEKMKNVFKFIGEGACGEVFALSEEHILKINTSRFANEHTPDGTILNDLQGVSFIPKLYCYSTCNRFIVVQRVKGVTVRQYLDGRDNFFMPSSLDSERDHLNKVKQFTKDCAKRGWYPNDAHKSNVMIDYKGNFWVVDVGLFQTDVYDTDDSEYDLVRYWYSVVSTIDFHMMKDRELYALTNPKKMETIFINPLEAVVQAF